MRKMLLIAAAAALLAPVAALANNKPPHPSQAKNDSHPAPMVLYILRGTLTPTYTGPSNTLTTIVIHVMSANRHGKTLKGESLTFTVGPTTKVVLHKHIAIAADDRGMVKVRFAKNSDPAGLQGAMATQIIDQGTHAYSGKGGSNAHASTRLYVLHGTLLTYTPISGSAPGTIVLKIAKANHDGGVLKNVALSFTVDSSTRVGPAKAAWNTNPPDRVIVKVLGPKTALKNASDLTGTAKQVIDQSK